MLDVTCADLSRHTTLRLGGPAGQLITISDQGELIRKLPEYDGTPLLLLAGGSNVVIADEGFAGTVILVRTRGIGVRRVDDGWVQVTVEAGHPWDDVVAMAVSEGLAGIECLSGVPGSTGATPMQNVGAYGQEVAETIASVRVFDRARAAVRDLPAPECGFAYRTSLFRRTDRFVVLAVTYRLAGSALSAPLRYAEAARALEVEAGSRVPLALVREAVLGLRAAKGMVLDPEDPDTYSVGSFFTNPVLDTAGFAALQARAQQVCGGDPAAWPGADSSVKVSAAWLIERAGFTKGYHGAHPGVGVSGKHTLALTNRGTGTTAALLDLARDIRAGVTAMFGVDLYPEPVLVGCRL